MKNWSIFSSNFIFRFMGKVMPVVFGGIEMSFWVRKKGRQSSIFGKATAARKFG